MSDPSPLASVIEACGGYARVGVAVSGGGDSVAALVLAVEGLGAGAVRAVTVDHGLRPESAAEAVQVGRLCAELGVAHDILRWAGPSRGNLQHQARQARLDLISGWARGQVEAVILAHTLDDQAETVLLRLARGSGVDGLSAMAPVRRDRGLDWLRPFLAVRREALRAVLRQRGIGWVEDPSNADPRFQRVRARQALAQLAPLGLDAPRLAATAARMREARAALEGQTLAAVHRLVRDAAGTVLIDKAALSLPVEIRDRLFAALVMALSGEPFRPRRAALRRWIDMGGALSGCRLAQEGGQLRLWRELRALEGLETSASETWDRRWRAQAPAPEAATRKTHDVVIRALGDDGLARLSAQAKAGLHPHWRETGLPRAVLASLPGLWAGNELVAAPLAMWPQGWRLSARPIAALVTELQQSH